MTNPVTVGVYDLGAESVEIALRAGTGADFTTRSGSIGPRQMPLIALGADQDDWSRLVAALVHEVYEVSAMRMGCRFVPDLDYARDAGGYVFVATHAQHSEICARVGYLLVECLPDLATAWKKWQKASQVRKG